MTALVTGGAGFIGPHIVAAVAACDDEPLFVDDVSTGIDTVVVGHP